MTVVPSALGWEWQQTFGGVGRTSWRVPVYRDMKARGRWGPKGRSCLARWLFRGLPAGIGKCFQCGLGTDDRARKCRKGWADAAGLTDAWSQMLRLGSLLSGLMLKPP